MNASIGCITSNGKTVFADGKHTVEYKNADGENVKVTPKGITLTIPYLSRAEITYADKYNMKYKYTDGTLPSSIPTPKATASRYIDDAWRATEYLTIDTSDGADFYRLYKLNISSDEYEFYKDVTSANNLVIDWGSYVVVAYYKDKNGGYVPSRLTSL